jgi:hypothetical protein
MIGSGRTNTLFGLFGQGLRQAGGQAESITPLMDRLKVGQLSRKILALPKQINKVLGSIMAQMKKVYKDIDLALIKIIEIDPTGPAHQFSLAFFVTFYHFVSSRARIVASVLMDGALPAYTHRRKVHSLIPSNLAASVNLYRFRVIQQSIAQKVKAIKD